MRFSRLAVLSLWTILPFLSIPVAAGTADAQQIHKENRLYYSNIAPGELENELIRKFPAKIMFLSETGKIYGGVFVRIFNASGIAIFKKMCEKPWLFLNLPEGDYNVVAVDRNKITRVKPFHVGGEGSRQTRVKMKWPKKAVGY